MYFKLAHPSYKTKQMITVSIVTHGHGVMLPKLLVQLLAMPEIKQIIVTINVPESIESTTDQRITLIRNQQPKGFGENHNQAFLLCKTLYFCVLNPDIDFNVNPFPRLLDSLYQTHAGLIAPMVKNKQGEIEDSIRCFPTLVSTLKRKLFFTYSDYKFSQDDPDFYVEWVAGIFMLFQSSAYSAVNGFDENYFMYVEDADICTRLWQADYRVLACPSSMIIHEARRASRHDWHHFHWHIASLLRYFTKYTGRLPKVH